MLNLGVKKSFGIDIGTQTIKITEVFKKGSSFVITNYSVWDDDIHNVIQQKNSDSALSAESINKVVKVMLKSANMNIKDAYIALPSYLSFSSTITIPILSAEELLTAIPLEAKKHIPVPLKNVQLDWINLGKDKSNNNYNILIIAIPNNIVERYKELSRLAGISIKGFELDCFSVLRAISLPNESVCVVDIGARNSMVMIVNSDKKLQSMQSFDFGGNYITELISKNRNMSILDAENIKKKNGVNGADEDIVDLIQSQIRLFIENDIVRFINSTKDNLNINISNIFLLGGSCRMSGMQQFFDSVIQSQFYGQSIKVSMASPVSNLRVNGVQDINTVVDIWNDIILSTGVALKSYVE